MVIFIGNLLHPLTKLPFASFFGAIHQGFLLVSDIH
jgi:hypothetical protein